MFMINLIVIYTNAMITKGEVKMAKNLSVEEQESLLNILKERF